MNDQKLASTMRVTAMALGHSLMHKVGLKFRPTAHFLSRFDIRGVSPVIAIQLFEVALRELHSRSPQINGKKVAILINRHLFIFDCANSICAPVTFWVTDKPAAEALAGRGDVLLSF